MDSPFQKSSVYIFKWVLWRSISSAAVEPNFDYATTSLNATALRRLCPMTAGGHAMRYSGADQLRRRRRPSRLRQKRAVGGASVLPYPQQTNVNRLTANVA